MVELRISGGLRAPRRPERLVYSTPGRDVGKWARYIGAPSGRQPRERPDRMGLRTRWDVRPYHGRWGDLDSTRDAGTGDPPVPGCGRVQRAHGLPDERRRRNRVAHLPNRRRWRDLGPSVPERASRRVLRLYGVLGCGPRNPLLRRDRGATLHPPNRRWRCLVESSARRRYLPPRTAKGDSRQAAAASPPRRAVEDGSRPAPPSVRECS